MGWGVCAECSRMYRMDACDISFVKPSAMFDSERTRPMFDMSCFLNPSRGAATSSIKRFSLVLDPRDIISNKDFESVKRSRWILRLIRELTSLQRVYAESNKSEKAITSAAIADRHSRFDLYDLK